MTKPVADARSVALSVFEKLSRPHPQPVQAVLDTVLRAGWLAGGLDPRQNGLVTELVYGVLRHEGRLNFLLNKFLRDAKKTPPKLRWVLLMALYALQYMDRTPAALSVDAFVKLAKQVCGENLGKVTNGVLRSFLRSEWAVCNAAKIEIEAGGGLAGLSVAYSVPVWMLECWQALELGQTSALEQAPECEQPLEFRQSDCCNYAKARSYAQAAACTPWPCVRINAAQPGAAELRNALREQGEAVGLWGVRFAPQVQPSNLDELQRDGRISRQGAGSILLMDAVMPYLHGNIWDGCAGFGGKTCAMLESGLTVSVASDIHRGRLAGLAREIMRLGLPAPVLCVASADKPPVARVDSILLDVPCSGLGTLARRPDMRRERKPEHLETLLALQARMLRAAWALLPEGGALVYATCALNTRENKEQVAAFLADTPTARLECEYTGAPDAFGSDLLYGAVLRVVSQLKGSAD